MSAKFRVGIVLRQGDVEANAKRLGAVAERIVAAGIDHATVGDHVSFADGMGADGFVQASALLASHPTLMVETGVYVLTLRHPAPVARQLATLCAIAPGRFTFGVGIGGDDPAELRLCGVDPAHRGARAEESLALLREFLGGAEVDFRGEFFTVEHGAIRPAPDPPPRIVVGGRADAAIERAGRHGDAWIGVWVSPRRFATARELFATAAGDAGREPAGAEHVLQLWAGFGENEVAGRAVVSRVMEREYGIAAERFERYVPCGRPEQVAAALSPYIEAGARRFNIVPEGSGLEAGIEAVGAVKQQLENEHGGAPHHARA
ncbi:MAG TPA: LLM class flavin-dependent oxidoreductase [Solirubrobacterales bacterium]|nr:LLM class flavin-dependent oxidoreductase [Solirubrobacterales bacterium]